MDNRLKAFQYSRAGEKHDENQDHCVVVQLSTESHLLVVADGIGSHPFGGSVARWLLNDHLSKLRLDSVDDVFSDFEKYVNETHRKMQLEFDGFDEFLSSGVSLTAVVVTEQTACCFWAGDSPAFHSTHDSRDIVQLTVPDVNLRGALTNYFAADHPLNLSHRQFGLTRGDRICLASDGANLEMSIFQAGVLKRWTKESIRDWIDQVTSNPGSDDATIIWYEHD